jgi:hypothetical protein
METKKTLGILANGNGEETIVPPYMHVTKTKNGTSTPQAIVQVQHTLKTCIAAYEGALALTGVIIPIVASLTMAGIYLAHLHIPLFALDPTLPWFPLISSTLISGIIWLLVAFCLSFFASAKTANTRSYGLLISRLGQLKASLSIENGDNATAALEQQSDAVRETMQKVRALKQNTIAKSPLTLRNTEVLNEACTCYIDICKMLYQSPAGMLWITGAGYINAWTLLHHAEEALIETQSIEEVIRGAIHDKLAIQGSKLNSQDELLDKLLQAVVTLEPTAEIYFKEHQPDKGNADLNLLTEAVKHRLLQDLTDKQNLQDIQNITDHSEAKALARVALREVRSTLNDFRDKSWEGIVRARNRLLGSIAVTGIMTHVLLAMAILTSNTTNAITAAAAFYLVGAVTGLFGRFYREATTGSAVDDFGFSTARLIATPLLSGLAGIGGVMLTVMLASLGDTLNKTGAITMNDIFHMDPRLFLAAAIFGLAPNLLIKGLQEEASKYATDIQSSKAAEPNT